MATTLQQKYSAAAVAVAGFLSLGVAMGVGRFAFTPMLPLMVGTDQITVALGGWLAAANYAGYLVGALLASRIPTSAARLGAVSIALIACATAAMALPSASAWLVLRFHAGVLSACVFVSTSVWCLGALAKLKRPDLGAWVYSGVGIGIAAAGLICLVGATSGVSPQLLWVQLGVLAAVLAVPVVMVLRSAPDGAVAASEPVGMEMKVPLGTKGLIVCYGVMGYGYIFPATFLPLLARNVVTDPAVFGWAWPIFGAMAAASTLIAGVILKRLSRLQVWAGCQMLMGVGALLPSVWSHGAAILLSAVLVGGTFMVITLAGVQEIRARFSWDAAKWVGFLTASFALGQIAGPVTSSLLLMHPELAERALNLGFQSASFLLLLSAAWLWKQANPSTLPKEISSVR